MSFDRSVSIGPEFFAKARNDYRDHFWAFAREIVQNCLDAPKTSRVAISIVEADGVTTVVVENDGQPMTEEILVGKLLSLGSSGKDNDPNAVGGFGKAKEILYFCHREYMIETGTLVVRGSGAGYNLDAATTPLLGTRSTIVWEGMHAARLERAFRKLLGMSQRLVEFTLNGERVQGGLGKGTRKRVFDWGATYTNAAIENQVVVRVNGMPMFWANTQCPQGVIVEITGKSTERLTSNRDGLIYPYYAELDGFITQLAIDSGSALRVAEPEYLHVQGDKLNNGVVGDEDDDDTNEKISATIAAIAALAASPVGQGSAGDVRGASEIDGRGGIFGGPPAQVSFDFVVKNTTGRKLPATFDPASERFSKAALRLTKTWVGCLLTLHRLTGNRDKFSVGFIFDIERYAEYEKGRYGRVYYVNPCVPGDAAFKQSLGPKDKYKILSYAAHEYVHGLGYDYHGEEYAAKLTQIMELVMTNLGEFTPCFKA